MNVCVFDTETISIDKPFAYNVGYVILDTDTHSILCEQDYVIEQCWHNKELFSTAYYAEKRPIYVAAMRGKRCKMDKWGYVMQAMYRQFKQYDVQCAYAYNSPFDDNVFSFNCDWYKTMNPLDDMPIYDIRGLCHTLVKDNDSFKVFCEKHKRFTESGNYSTTAETMYQWIMDRPDFIEEHTALADSQIEASILMWAINSGLEWEKNYPTAKSIQRLVEKPLTIKIDGQVLYKGQYIKKSIRKYTYSFTTLSP